MCTFCKVILYCHIISYVHLQGISFDENPPTNQCRTPSGQKGICTILAKCPKYAKGIDLTNPPTICDYEKHSVIICCPNTSPTGFLSKGEGGGTILLPNNNIIETPNTNFQCGINQFIETSRNRTAMLTNLMSPRRMQLRSQTEDLTLTPSIAGGIKAIRNSWPWMALLGKKRNLDNIFYCDGVLLNENFVLTAAHCLLDKTPFFVRLGEYDYGDLSASGSIPEDRTVKSVMFYPLYDSNLGYHDLALIELSHAVAISDSVRPICLPWGNVINEDLVHKRVVVTGWGAERFGGKPSSILREVEITVFAPAACEKSYSTLADFQITWPQGMKTDSIVCAGEKNGGKDACQGDSGGPMVIKQPDESYSLVGIVSKGYGCGRPDFPGVYAPIRNLDHLQWIKNIAFQGF